MILGVTDNRFDLLRRNFELFRDFRYAHSVVKIINNHMNRYPCTAQHGSAALHAGLISTNGHSDQSICSLLSIIVSLRPSFHVSARNGRKYPYAL